MRHFDMTPLYRATVGFDQIADLMDRVLQSEGRDQSYPPYNIEKTGEDSWRISVAVAGFSAEDLNVELRDNALIITAQKADEESSESTQERVYLHRGIATRAFERRFTLAEHVRVTNAAHIDGMLHIDLVREIPEALKPRQIPIAKSLDSKVEAVEAKPVN